MRALDQYPPGQYIKIWGVSYIRYKSFIPGSDKNYLQLTNLLKVKYLTLYSLGLNKQYTVSQVKLPFSIKHCDPRVDLGNTCKGTSDFTLFPNFG